MLRMTCHESCVLCSSWWSGGHPSERSRRGVSGVLQGLHDVHDMAGTAGRLAFVCAGGFTQKG